MTLKLSQIIKQPKMYPLCVKFFMLLPYLKKIGLLGISNRNKLISDYNINILFNSVVNKKIKQQFSMSVPENITVVSTSYWILKMYEP